MIRRDLQSAMDRDHDLIVVGGGIYGVMLALEAARHGLCPLLVEKDDFGQATSRVPLGILHGGLRYLQTLDLTRFRESVRERSWFLRHFPNLVKPLPCLMPLYGRGLQRPSIFRVALALNDVLSLRRNQGVEPDCQMPGGRILTGQQTMELFRDVDSEGLIGGALWYDAFTCDWQRLLMELLQWSCRLNAIALNYVAARRLILQGHRIAGLVASDAKTGDELQFRAPVIVNCAGPWCRQIA